jgi:hypothetical protein
LAGHTRWSTAGKLIELIGEHPHYQAGGIVNPQVVDWAAVPGPAWYRPDTVEQAFAGLLRASLRDEDYGGGVRSAVGNDHAGTLYPAAVAATEVLLGIIAERPDGPRRAALSVLLDWWGVFHPEPGFEAFTDTDGRTVHVVPAIVERIRQAAPVLEEVAAHDPGNRRLVRELTAALGRGWSGGQARET